MLLLSALYTGFKMGCFCDSVVQDCCLGAEALPGL